MSSELSSKSPYCSSLDLTGGFVTDLHDHHVILSLAERRGGEEQHESKPHQGFTRGIEDVCNFIVVYRSGLDSTNPKVDKLSFS